LQHMQGEAFFIGTVAHSLDHGLMALAMEVSALGLMRAIVGNALALMPHRRVVCVREILFSLPAQFGAMAEYGRIIRVSFASKTFRGLRFPLSSKNVNVPFFTGINYEHAVKNNRILADTDGRMYHQVNPVSTAAEQTPM